MADVSKIKLGSTTYDIKDTNAVRGTVSIYYGTCSTSSDIVNKEVILNDSNITALDFVRGMIFIVRFSNSNLATEPTLTIFNNSGTDAVPVKGETTLLAAKSIHKYSGDSIASDYIGSWSSNAIVSFTYDGSRWVEISSWNYNKVGYAHCAVDSNNSTQFNATINPDITMGKGSIFVLGFTYGGITVSNPTLKINSLVAKNIKWRGSNLTDTTYIKTGDKVIFVYDGSYYNIISKDTPHVLTKITSSVAGATSVSVTPRNNRVASSDDYLLTFATNVTALTDNTSLSV